MIKGVSHAHLGPFWYQTEPSDVPYFPNQFSIHNFLPRQEIEEWAEVFAGNNFARHTVHSPETFQTRVCI